jgi:hypothetical protein
LLNYGIAKIKLGEAGSLLNTSKIFGLGFGATDFRAVLASYFPTDIISLALIANSPQVILSFLYLVYNGLFTSMLTGYEWTSYAYKKKGLRISRKPAGNQRSTYFLQLPYKFGVPLVVMSGTLHWLVSQSLFVVAVDAYDKWGNVAGSGYGTERTCGFSPIAILSVVIVGATMLVAVIAFGFIPYKRGMPLVGSCSLAISAACHPDQYDEDKGSLLSEQKLQWGVVSTGEDGIGHCAFSGKEVTQPIKGQTYA